MCGVNGPYLRNCNSIIIVKLDLYESLLYLILSIKDTPPLFCIQLNENFKIIFLWHIKKMAVDDEMKRTSKRRPPCSLGSKSCVFVNDNLGTLRLEAEDRQ